MKKKNRKQKETNENTNSSASSSGKELTENLFNAFKELDAKTKERRPSSEYPRKWFDLCNAGAIGSIFGRPVPDSFNRLYREINWYSEISYPVIGHDGEPVYEENKKSKHPKLKREEKIIWMASKNYHPPLRGKQRMLNNELGKQLQRLNDFRIAHIKDKTVGKIIRKFLWITYVEKFFLMYMKVRKLAPEYRGGFGFRNTEGWISVLYHRGKKFGKVFDKAVADKTSELGSTEWMKECFSRDVPISKYILSITTPPPKRTEFNTFETQMKISETEGGGIFLNESDRDVTRDLMKELIPDTFDEAQVRKNLDSLKGYIADICKRTGLKLDGGDVADSTPDEPLKETP